MLPWPSPRPYRSRNLILLVLLIPCFYLFFRCLKPAFQNHTLSHFDQLKLEASYTNRNNHSVNLVVASTAKDEPEWAYNLSIPNLKVIRYVSDSKSAPYHPALPKGREALMGLTYLHDFYDDLPDISIFVHAEERPWHMDGALLESMPFALTHLDLEQVLAQEYFNLRISWKHGCPAQIRTANTTWDEKKQEQRLMATAFREIFGPEEEVPEILAGSCCSQFAVTRDAIRRRGRHEYKHYVDWLIASEWSDYITGRVWEHLWPVVFLNKPVECLVEWKALCRMYRICFEGHKSFKDYQQVWDWKRHLDAEITFWKEFFRPREVALMRRRMEEYASWLSVSLRSASQRGQEDNVRGEVLGDLYVF